MAERTKFLGVTMEAATAERLAQLDAERRIPTSGLWLYAIVRAIPYRQLLIQSDDLYVIHWLALASQYHKGSFELLVKGESAEALRDSLEKLGWNPSFLYTKWSWGTMSWYDEADGVRYVDDSASAQRFDTAPYGTTGNDLVITPSHEKNLVSVPHYESVVVGGAWRLYGGQKIPYPAGEREKLVAILLAAMQPKTLALGMNVVFDGKLKPPKSKINFSGTGGQIGEGDVLICHPDDLNRYSPLPGAVALVLGELTEPVHAFTCALPVGDEVLTIVIK